MALAIFISVLSAPVAKGQSPAGGTTATAVVPSPLPDRLPIGDPNIVEEYLKTDMSWLVKGNLNINVNAQWTLSTPDVDPLTTPSSNWHYLSVEDFDNATIRACKGLMKTLKQNGLKPDAIVTCEVVILYFDTTPGKKPKLLTPLKGLKVLGRADGISDDSFRNIPITSKKVVVRIPGLEQVRLTVDNEDGYTNQWPGTSFVPGYLREETTDGILVMHGWYAEGQFPLRLELTVNGFRGTYTQYGYLIKPPVLRVIDDSHVLVSSTPGCKTTIYTKTSLDGEWMVMKVITSDQSGTQIVLVYPPGSPQRFFMAMSQ